MIPKILHQIWLGPRPRLEGMKSWPAMHPDWSYRLWTEDSLPVMQRRDLFDAFHGVYHAQADVLRYEVLYQHGGVYLDADSLCVRALAPALREREWACAENDRGLLANSFLGMEKGSPLMAAVLKELAKIDVNTVAREPRAALARVAWVLTGPCCLSEVVRETKYDLHVLPQRAFLPRNGEQPIYARHFGYTTNQLRRGLEPSDG